ncbi:MAG: hypothetical protein JXQ23_11845 [Clostridia bacterium]|nr:hypothetical protein [Clostridia bacterium]
MAGRDDIIHGFTRLVMKEASDKRQHIIDEVTKEKKDLLDQKEREFLEKAYIKVQDAVKETKRIRNEDYSKAMLESKKTLLMTRTKIMEDVFDSVLKRFEKFRESDEYEKWLEKLLKDGAEKINSDEYLVFCEQVDQKIVEKAVKQLNMKAKIISDLEEVYGGVILECKQKGLLLDLTVKEMIVEAKADFMCYCGLCVNRW